MLINKKKIKECFVKLKTPYEKELEGGGIPFSQYPRPQLVRDSYFCLNGEWELSVRVKGEETPLGRIIVPFPPESRISGIERLTGGNETLVYTRTFTLPEGFKKDRVILHFGAVDQHARVTVNGALAGEHEGGYLPFSFDITSLLAQGENTLTVEVTDPLDSELPYGKQREKRGGMWYTKISGIWQTVWAESVPAEYIRSVTVTPTLDSVAVKVTGGTARKELTLRLGEEERVYSFDGDSVTITVDDPVLWTPEDPHLYEFTLSSAEDTVSSYFALRTVSVEEGSGGKVLALNGKPYFFHGLLDQGYYSDGIYLPASVQGYKDDILRMKECGFNMLRKHIKIEPELFYYYCDKYGMVVFQDMVNSGRYNFIIDTAIPNVLLKRGITHRATERRRAAFYECADGMMELLYNHPCVCYYTIFNEGWGQFEADANYLRFKEKDPTRIYDTTSGWFREKLSDVESDHIYFRPVKIKRRSERPRVLSEFGGYSCRVSGHTYNLEGNYGCSVFTEDPAELEAALVALYEKQIVPAVGMGLCGAVLTQLSDVEDETNGLLTYDRCTLKVTPEVMRDVADKLHAAFDKANNK